MHIDGIDGESKGDKHSQWIEVLSVNWSIQRDIGEQHHGALAPVESVTFSFEEIEYEFTEQKPDGSQSESGFSHKLGKKH